MPRKFKLTANDQVSPCPKCGNNVEFNAHSVQVAEDCCEVHVVCSCGFDSTAGDTSSRFEDVMGSTGDENVWAAMSCWNDALANLPTGAS